MSISVIRTLILYVLILIMLRLTGKRQISELQTSELVVTLLISNIAVIPMQDTSLPLQQRRDQTYGYWIASISRRTGKIEEYPYRAVTSGCPGTIL